MRVDRVYGSNVSATHRRERTGKKISDGFQTALTSEVENDTSVSGNAPAGSLTGVLAAQEVEDPTHERRRAMQRGHSLLDQLENLRRALVMGTLSPERIERLASFVASRKEKIEDPVLAEVLNEIEIRAAVEAAKFGR